MATIECVGKDMLGYGGPDWTCNGRELGIAVKCGLLVNHYQKTRSTDTDTGAGNKTKHSSN